MRGIAQALIKGHGAFAGVETHFLIASLLREHFGMGHQVTTYAFALQLNIYRHLTHLYLAGANGFKHQAGHQRLLKVSPNMLGIGFRRELLR